VHDSNFGNEYDIKDLIMRLVNILALLIFPITICPGQNPNVKIVGQIIGYSGSGKINYSIAPFPNSFNQQSIQPDSSGQFVINKFITSTHFFSMHYSQNDTIHTCRLILKPHNYYKFISSGYKPDGINWDIYYSPEIFKLKYVNEGSPYLASDVGQMYFNLIDNGTMGDLYRAEWDLNRPESLIDTLQARIKRQESIFTNLLEKGEIDNGFFQLAKLNIEYFNAYKLAVTVSEIWYMNQSEITDTTFCNRLFDIYPKIFELYPVKGADMEHIFGFERYVSLYLCFREDYINGVFKPKVRKGPTYLKTMQTSDDVLSEQANKYFKMLNGISYVYSLDLNAAQYGKELLEKYPDHNDTQVGQLVENVLIPRAEKFEKLSEEEFSQDITILDRSNPINSIQQLLDSLKGQPALIDCWATWCAPCIGQFRYNKELKPFLKKNGIRMVYIGYELDGNRKKWENFIKAYDLSGYNLMANDKLRDQLKEFFNGYIILPAYMIVDSNGKILIKNAKYPSEGKFLYEQLKAELEL